MSTSNPNTINALESTLRRTPGPDPTAWVRIRRDLFRRADTEGLIDVALERHDSPLGPILLGATHAGLVRVGLAAEGEDAVLDELTLRVSRRVLKGPRDTVTRARHQLDEYFNATRRRFELCGH